jgi:hypothetical protein
MIETPSNLESMLVTCGQTASKKFQTIFFGPSRGLKKAFETPAETHDVVQDPTHPLRFAAFGRRPPTKQSFILQLDRPGTVKAFSAIPGHSFYGHGFWTTDNVLGTAEIDSDGKSAIVLRNGDDPETVIRIIESPCIAIHMVEYDAASQTLVVAHNGDYMSATRAVHRGACLELRSLETERSERFFFPELPYTFGFQHFSKTGEEVYCLFRIPPDVAHDPTCNANPLVKLNLRSGERKFLQFPSRELLDKFFSDALSIQVSERYIAVTGQRGNLFCVWDRRTEEFLFSIPLVVPSGVTIHGDVAYVSSVFGWLYEVDLVARTPKIVDREFFAWSHHQAVSVPAGSI